MRRTLQLGTRAHRKKLQNRHTTKCLKKDSSLHSVCVPNSLSLCSACYENSFLDTEGLKKACVNNIYMESQELKWPA